MAHIEFIDQTLRDGQQSLWGMRMRACQATPALPHLNATGFDTFDLAGGTFFVVMLRESGDDPWAALDWLSRACLDTLSLPIAHPLLLREREIHSNRRNDGHRLLIQHRGLVAPLLDSIDGCLNQQRVSRNYFKVIDRSFFADFSFQNDDTLDARLLRQWGIDRLHLRDQVRCDNISTNADALRRWRWGRRRRWGRRWSRFFLLLQNASQHA